MIEAAMQVFIPDSLEVWIYEKKPIVSMKEMTPSGELIAPAFIMLPPGTARFLQTAPTPVGWALHSSEDPNCILIPGAGLWTLWTIKEVAPRQPLSIDHRLYAL